MAQSPNFPTLEQAIDDVEARFLYNLPRNELEHTERLFFQIEQAYWFYEDFKADVYNHLPHFSSLKAFATKLFAHSALLSKAGDKFQELFTDFRNYKSKIPVYGCIMLNPKMTKVVLVCDYNGKSWTFPRGKINENETEFSCGMRETLEETGYDPTPHCREEDNLLSFIEGKQIKLYVACNVPESTIFTIMTRKEISKVEFHPLDNLPKTYAVSPFLEKLKRWINKRRQLNAQMLKSPNLKTQANSIATKSPGRNTTTATTTKSKRNQQSNPDKSPIFQSASPTLTSMNTTAAAHPSPNTAKRMKNVFDQRNIDTFEGEDSTKEGWGVNAMFAANSKITGKNYSYDGNPHNFGSSHPRFVNYTNKEDAVSSRSILDSATSPSFPMFHSSSTMENYNYSRGIAINTASSKQQQDEDDSFLALSQQSLLGNQLLRSDRAKDPTNHEKLIFPSTATIAAAVVAGEGHQFSLLPTSAYKYDALAMKGAAAKSSRHDSFDSTHSKDYEDSGVGIKVIFPVNFKLDRAAIMSAFDRALQQKA